MFKKIFIIISSLGVLIACGYKGPLYLPQNKPAPSSPANNAFAPDPNQVESHAPKSLLPATISESAINESGMTESHSK